MYDGDFLIVFKSMPQRMCFDQYKASVCNTHRCGCRVLTLLSKLRLRESSLGVPDGIAARWFLGDTMSIEYDAY